ncbi:MAG: pitrilysin family protein [Phycisphaerales bacterium]
MSIARCVVGLGTAAFLALAPSAFVGTVAADPPATPARLGAPPRNDAPLPTDPAIVTGQLDNGLRYVVQRHAVPPGRAVMWIHMHTGSLNETDRQRGIAHYLEHMAFNGSKRFAPGSLVPFFESLGMTFGRDQNAFTNFDQTTFQLSLPKADADTLGKGMGFFADVVNDLSLLPSEIDNERQIILEERRRGLSGRQRVQDMLSERLAPGSLYGVRSPIGTEETIKSVNEKDFHDYYGTWYAPSNATLIVVADADPADVIKVIKEQFGGLPKKARPTPQALNVKPYDKSFAVVATDPEVRSEDVRIVRIEPARPATTTIAQYRDDLVDLLGTAALNRRLSEKVAAGNTSYQNARVSTSNDSNAIYTVEVSGRPSTGKWKEAIEEISLELQRARAFGFTQRELDEVNKGLLAGAERAVETESTAAASAIISRINNYVSSGEPIMSAEQRLELLKKTLPTITPAEVSSRFAREFDPKAVAFVAVLRSGDKIPTEAELLAVGTKALEVKPTQEQEVAHATQLMAQAPAPGKVAEGAEHEATHVWSGWLDNNVRVHHRFMDERKNEVSVQISLIGGEMLEDASNRGITSAAQLAFSRPATKHLSSTDIRDLMNGKKVSAGGGGFARGGRGGGGRGGRGGGGGGGDSISLSVSGSPDELETGFQLAYLLLTEPKIEQAAFDQFITSTREGIEESLTNPMSVGARTSASAIYPDNDVRFRPLEGSDLDRLKLDAAQAWLEKLLRESPIEVTIVGDIGREKALDLAAKYLGALPKRQRVDPTTYESLRHVKRPSGERVVEKSLDTPTEQAFVFVGFYGADESNRADARALNMAARILSMRMVKQVREEAQLVYSISAGSRAASTYPGFGVFSASAPTDPAKVPALVSKLRSMYDEFAKSGPTEEELVTAKKQMDNTFSEQLKEPSFWAGRLNQMTFRGAKIDDVLSEPEAYQAMTSAQIQDAFKRYYTKDSTIVVVVKPEASKAAGATGS